MRHLCLLAITLSTACGAPPADVEVDAGAPAAAPDAPPDAGSAPLPDPCACIHATGRADAATTTCLQGLGLLQPARCVTFTCPQTSGEVWLTTACLPPTDRPGIPDECRLQHQPGRRVRIDAACVYWVGMGRDL